MGEGGHPWFLYGSLYTSSQLGEEDGVQALGKGCLSRAAPPRPTYTHPQSREVAKGERNTCRPPTWSPSLTDGKSDQSWLFTDMGPSHPSRGPTLRSK